MNFKINPRLIKETLAGWKTGSRREYLAGLGVTEDHDHVVGRIGNSGTHTHLFTVTLLVFPDGDRVLHQAFSTCGSRQSGSAEYLVESDAQVTCSKCLNRMGGA